MVHDDMIRYDAICHNTIHYNVIHYDTIDYDKIHYETSQYDTIRYVFIVSLFVDFMNCHQVFHGFIHSGTVLDKHSILHAVQQTCVLQYLCNVLGWAAPAREYSTEDGRPPQTTPGPSPRPLSWRGEARCTPPVWTSPPNYGSHCCPSENMIHDGKK